MNDLTIKLSAQLFAAFLPRYAYGKPRKVRVIRRVSSAGRKPPSRSAPRERPYCAERETIEGEHHHVAFLWGMTEISVLISCTLSPGPMFPGIAEKFHETFHSTYRERKARRTVRRVARFPTFSHLFCRLRCSCSRTVDAGLSTDVGLEREKLSYSRIDQTPAMAWISPERNTRHCLSLFLSLFALSLSLFLSVWSSIELEPAHCHEYCIIVVVFARCYFYQWTRELGDGGTKCARRAGRALNDRRSPIRSSARTPYSLASNVCVCTYVSARENRATETVPPPDDVSSDLSVASGAPFSSTLGANTRNKRSGRINHAE